MDTSSLENPAAASSKKQVLSEIPDGGFRAWIIVVASFLTNGLIFGIHNCYGLIYLQLKNQLEELNIDDAPIKSCRSPIRAIVNNSWPIDLTWL